MKDQFVPYELAVKLKELGFNEECLARYCEVTEWEKPTGEINLQLFLDASIEDKDLIKAPLWQQVFDWFREKGIDSWVSKSFGCYNVNIVKTNDEQENEDVSYGLTWKDFKTYEEARLACLEKLIEL